MNFSGVKSYKLMTLFWMFRLLASSDKAVANLYAVPVYEPKYMLSNGMFNLSGKGEGRIEFFLIEDCLNGLLRLNYKTYCFFKLTVCETH